MTPCTSLDPRGWRTATLHVVGDRTLYRVSASTPLTQIAPDAYRLADDLLERPQGLPARSWENLKDFWLACEKIGRTSARPVVLTAAEKGVRDFFSACESVGELFTVEKWLLILKDEGLVRQTASGWTLTPEGVAESVAVRDLCSPVNVTACWVERVIDKAYLGKLVSHLQYNCARSAAFNELSDLVHGYLLSLINRNGLQARLARGCHPSPSNIRTWCYKSALSRFRDEGRDALTRSFKGARTEKDLRLAVDEDVTLRSLPADTRAIFLSPEDEGGSAFVSGAPHAHPLLDVVGGNFEDEILHRMTAQRGIALAEAAVRREKAGAPDRFARLLTMVLSDTGFREIGLAEGVSRNRAASLVADLRAAVQQAISHSNEAAKVLECIREEPCSTLEDIHAALTEQAQAAWEKEVSDAGGDDSVVGALDLSFLERINDNLLDALVSAGRAKRVGRGGFVVTSSGEAILESGDHFGLEINISP